MERSHIKYNCSTYEKYRISCITFVHGAHDSACVQNNIFMTHYHVEHIGIACLQYRKSCLVRPLITHIVFRLD